LGKLITSGKTVHGFETNFPSQLAIGDHIILMTQEANGKLVESERRRVNMVLSAKSCGLEEPFTEDIMDKYEYWV
jgi:tRNA G37 N-methylase TrmD